MAATLRNIRSMIKAQQRRKNAKGRLPKPKPGGMALARQLLDNYCLTESVESDPEEKKHDLPGI